jgi:hypothetical protein
LPLRRRSGPGYELRCVELDNGSCLFGDQVGVAVRWQHPGQDAADLLSPDAIAVIRETVGAGSWREGPRAAMWVGKAVAAALDLDAEEDKTKIKELKASL